MRVAPHTGVRPDVISAYEAAHREVPEELTAAIRAAGATSWTLHRSGPDLLHVQDCARLPAALERLPVDVARRSRTAGLPDAVHDCSGPGADAGPPVVGERP
ncbi:L-rhamnose mutarotase [Streptomyces griseoloalbus]|uniref:L-rhamnose mutarotase n=1 Tax=Streptomyces griseoloalbus TaxID=67303 RepID=A0A7W8BNU6_9ACTN|nr:L-rhamnose mutarotase [Streptomyces albaduncus]MBB5125771.1 L-rhamnose mutarotase [Streptomyces albaduncus]GGW55306.1 hypothetical protein GCM10010340_37300 [Streptomyces albaduncus]